MKIKTSEQTFEESFEECWLKGEMPDNRGYGGGIASPSSMAQSNRKQAALFCYQYAMLSSAKKIQELEEKLREAYEQGFDVGYLGEINED